MIWQEALAQLRRDLRVYTEEKVFSLFGWTLTARSSELGDKDAVQTADGESTQRPARRIEPFGFRSRPPNGMRCLTIKIGTSNVIMIGIGSTAKYGPQDLEDGEVSMYGPVAGSDTRFDKDGNVKTKSAADVTVNAAADVTVDAPSGEINLQSGTQGVARIGDQVTATGFMSAWISDVAAAINQLAADVHDGTINIGLPSSFGTITTGSGSVKAGD